MQQLDPIQDHIIRNSRDFYPEDTRLETGVTSSDIFSLSTAECRNKSFKESVQNCDEKPPGPPKKRER